MKFRLSKNDSSDIGFALACLTCGAIHFREFKDWLFYVIEHGEDPPGYIFDMLDIDLRVDFKPHEIMGFVATTGLSGEELDALTGIGFQRGIVEKEDTVSRSNALKKLQDNPVFQQRFRQFFPFLDIHSQVGADPDTGW